MEIITKYPKVVSKLRKGLSAWDIASVCNVFPQTVQKVKRTIGKKPVKKQPFADDSAGKLSGLARYAWAWENGKYAVDMAEELKIEKQLYMTAEEAIDYDVAMSILNEMFAYAIKAKQTTDDKAEQERMDKQLDMYRWKISQMRSMDESANRSILDKVFNFYAPMIKASVREPGREPG